MTTPLANFTETASRSAKLVAALGHVQPVSTTAQASIWLSALTALCPRHTVAEILGAWPTNIEANTTGWWQLLTNLGYQVITSQTAEARSGNTACWLRPDGDIWISHDSRHIWKSRSNTVAQVKNLPRGDWLPLALPDAAPRPNTTLGDILLTTFKPVMPSLFVSSLLVQVMGVLVPVFIMVVYNHVIDGRAQVGYNGLLAGLIVVLLTEAAMRRIRGHLLVRAGLRAETLWVNRIMAQLIHLPAALVERASLSSQISRLRGVDIFRDTATSPIVLGVLDIPFILVTLFTLYLVAGTLVLVPLVLIGAYIMFMLVCLPWVKATLRKQASASEQRQTLVLEASQNSLALRADGLTDHWLTRIETNGRNAMKATAQGTFMQHFLEVASLFGSSTAGLLTLYTGMGMVQAGTLTAGGLVASMMLVWRMLAPLSLLCTALPRLVQLFQTALQVAEFLNLTTETPPQAAPTPAQLAHATPRGEVSLHNLSLRYMREHAQVLNNLSATLPAGSLVVVMGGNGTGKSSLLKIIAGLYPLQSGAVRLDGVDIRQWDTERLRSHIAYLPQAPDIFNDTVAANLGLANPLATESEIWQALERAGAAETVRQMNHGLHEPLSHLALPELFPHQLSLARLYLHTGPLILADELPAPLATGPEAAAFHQWLLSQRGTRTVVVVSNAAVLAKGAALAIGLLPEGRNITGTADKVLARLRNVAHATTIEASPSLTFNKDISHAA